jgi:hypothetical protein
MLHVLASTSSDQPDILPALYFLDARTLSQLFHKAYATDPFPNKVLQMLKDGTKQCKDITLPECEEHNDLLLYRRQIRVPEYEPLRLHLMQQHHDTPTAEHPGRSKTLEYLSRTYTWPKMCADVDHYTQNCHTCERSKSNRHTPFGMLRPLLGTTKGYVYQEIGNTQEGNLAWGRGQYRRVYRLFSAAEPFSFQRKQLLFP